MGASLVGDDVWEYQSSDYQETPSYPKLTLTRSSILLASTTLQLYLQFPQLTFTTLKLTFRLALGRISLIFAFLSLNSIYPFKTGWWTRIWTRNLYPSFSLFSGLES